MPAAAWLCGQEPTQANAHTLLGRLGRQAFSASLRLDIDHAEAALAEAELIKAMLADGLLEEGRPLASASKAQSVANIFSPSKAPSERSSLAKAQAPATYSRWHYLYKALSGRVPPSSPHNAKFKAKWGQHFFLAASGRLTQGLTVRRSVALARAKEAELLKQGREELLPKGPKTQASAAEIMEMF